jgi:4-hydroxybenzoate polyprenyltransferase/phosphoserine phosphatase
MLTGEPLLPLCIDLDGTLIRCDLLAESALKALKLMPVAAVRAFTGVFRGKACLKQQLASLVDVRADLLPYNDKVLELARTARAEGRPVILVTAANRYYAQAVADHVGLFDAVYGSSDSHNLSAGNKASLLVSLFGEKGFDYAGDSRDDLKVFPHARSCILVNPEASVERQLKMRQIPYQLVADRSFFMSTVLKALRPHQWLKNILVFLPLATAHLWGDLQSVLISLMAFFCFSCMASAGYLINDLLDLEADRQHPRRQRRPLASGKLKVSHAMGLIASLALAGLLVSGLISTDFMSILLLYLLTTLGYSFYFKRRPTIDVLLLAGLYTLRVIGGDVALHLSQSFWLLAFSMFMFLSLAYVKRYAELHELRANDRNWVEGRGYAADDLPLIGAFGISAGYGAVLVMALYINSPEIRVLYLHPERIWLICPVLLFWIARLWTIAHRGHMHYDPVIFAMQDRVSLGILAVTALIIFLAI